MMAATNTKSININIFVTLRLMALSRRKLSCRKRCILKILNILSVLNIRSTVSVCVAGISRLR